MEAASTAPRTTPSPSPYFPSTSLLGLGGLGLLASGLGSGGLGLGVPGHAHYAGSLISRESSRDDLASMMGDGQVFEYEERFRVDRRKLELLMQGRFELVHEPAIDFFGRIGEETNTTVIWPSRLKVGAKSKKDPHIRVGGAEEGVKRAKCLILEFLDTKSTRVTMKMDVSYTDHSHVIGKGGNTIRRVMAETNCHIHFPDSNRNNPNEKSNQVSIAGEMDGVEIARARVRELTPLIFNFDLPIIPSLQAGLPNPEDPFLKAIQDQYNVQIMFRQKQKNFHSTMVVVKGCEWEASRVKEATLLLMDHLCCGGVVNGGVMGLTPGEMIVSMTMEISPQHHSIVLGKSNMTLKLIMQKTNTTILFPDAADPNIPSIKKGSVTINGSIHNVYIARQQLIGSLPLVMMFDLPDEVELEDAFVQKLQEDLDVSISIKPKARQSNKSVIIKAQERNASNIYKARSILLNLEEETIQASIPETYNMQLGTFSSSNNMAPTGSFNNLLHVGSFNNNLPPVGSLNSNHAASTGGGPHSSVSSLGSLLPPMTPSTPWSAGPSPSVAAKQYQASQQQHSSFFPFGGPGNALPPNHPYLQDYALLVLNNITRMQQQQQQQQQQQPHQLPHQLHDPQAWKLQDPKMRQQNSREENNNLIASVGRSSSDSPPIPGKSPRNSSPMHEDGNLTAALAKLEMSQSQHSFGNSSNGDKANCGGIQSSQNSTSGVFSSSAGGKSTANGSNGGQMLPFFGDRRAPGCEKTILKMAQTRDFVGEYDHKRLMASKAVQSKPSSGEVRTPTSAWAGLGFSCSMPEAVMREQLEASSLKVVRESLLDDVDENDEAKRHEEDDLPSVFAKQGLAKYTDLFLRHEIDLPTLASLNEEDLKEIGIQTFGARKKIMLLANKLKQTLSEKW